MRFTKRVMRTYMVYREAGMTDSNSFSRWFHAELVRDGVEVSESTCYRWLGNGVPDDRFSEADATLARLIREAALQLGKWMRELKEAE